MLRFYPFIKKESLLNTKKETNLDVNNKERTVIRQQIILAGIQHMYHFVFRRYSFKKLFSTRHFLWHFWVIFLPFNVLTVGTVSSLWHKRKRTEITNDFCLKMTNGNSVHFNDEILIHWHFKNAIVPYQWKWALIRVWHYR